MIFHENRLPADDSLEISCHIVIFEKEAKFEIVICCKLKVALYCLRDFLIVSDLPHYVLPVIVYQQNPLVTMTLVFSIDQTQAPLLEELVGVALDHASKMPRLMLHQQTLTELYH